MRKSALVLAILSGLLASGAATAQINYPIVNRGEWWRSGATLDMDFLADRYYLNGTAYNNIGSFIAGSGATFTRARAVTASDLPPFYLAGNQTFDSRISTASNITNEMHPFYADAGQAFVSRASTGTYFDSTGNLQTAATNTARTDYNPVTLALNGTLIEPATTNYVQNSLFNGFPAVGTTITSSGMIGTGNHWFMTATPPLTVTIAGSGIQNGIAYLDLRLQGTNNTGINLFPGLAFASGDYTSVTPGTMTALSAWFGVSAYSASGGTCSVRFSNRSFDASKVLLAALDKSYLATSPYVYTSNVLTHGTNAAFSAPNFYILWPNGATCDVTMRIGAPQLEMQGTPTSYMPTTGAGPVSRAADVFAQQPATYFNSTSMMRSAASNAARLDYDQVFGATANGTLIEPLSRNLLPYSLFGGISGPGKYPTGWAVTGAASSAVSLFDGPVTGFPAKYAALRQAAGGAAGSLQGLQSNAITYALNTPYTISIYARAPQDGATATDAALSFGSGTTASACSAIVSAANLTSSWRRFSTTCTFTAAPSVTSFVITTNSASAAPRGIDLALPQVEARSTPTSFIPTYGASSTRAGDSYAATAYGSYINSAGLIVSTTTNIPRLDYDPVGRYPKGILIEEPRLNMLASSSDYTAGSWSRNNLTVTPNAITAPDGTVSGSLVQGVNGVTSWLTQIARTVTGSSLTRSVYMKAGTTSKIFLEVVKGWPSGPTYANGSCDVATGTTSGNGATSVSLTPAGNGWFRCVATFPATDNLPLRSGAIYIENYGIGTGKNIYLWGAQTEEGAFATSYIPTSATTMARAQDIFYFPTSGWYDETKGTMLADTYGQFNSTFSNGGGFGRIIGLSSSKAPLNFGSTLSNIQSWNGTTVTSRGLSGAASTSQSVRLGMAWNDSGSNVSVTGQALMPASATYGGNWSASVIIIGGGNISGTYGQLNAPIRRVTYLPVSSSDAVLMDYTR